MYEGMLAGIVSRKGFVKIGEQNYGRLKDIITKNSREEDQSFFQPFHEALRGIANAGNSDFDEEGKTANQSYLGREWLKQIAKNLVTISMSYQHIIIAQTMHSKHK
jgi:hypothetical protein